MIPGESQWVLSLLYGPKTAQQESWLLLTALGAGPSAYSPTSIVVHCHRHRVGGWSSPAKYDEGPLPARNEAKWILAPFFDFFD